MKKITPEAQKLAEEAAPKFITAVQKSKEARQAHHEEVSVITSLEAFNDDPMLLYACLWYASSEEIAVTMLPAEGC